MNELKEILICPICGKPAFLNKAHYICDHCKWDSLSEKTVDILYKDEISGPLSNLYPHKFLFYTPGVDAVNCLSMESFIQSLRVENPEIQKYICENIPGHDAKKISKTLGNWQNNGIVYWRGKPINRNSAEYDNLITKAYDALFEGNKVFSELVLPRFKDKILIHSIGKDNKAETLLTECEFRYQLTRLIEKLPK